MDTNSSSPITLGTSHPVGELEYILKDSEAKSIILGEGDTKQEGIFAERIKPLAKQLDIPIHTLPPHPTSLSTDQVGDPTSEQDASQLTRLDLATPFSSYPSLFIIMLTILSLLHTAQYDPL